MANDRASSQRPGADTGGAEDAGTGRKEQFNELSELSLEERMAVADRIGIPVYTEPDAAATGTMSGFDESSGDFNDQKEENSTIESPDR